MEPTHRVDQSQTLVIGQSQGTRFLIISLGANTELICCENEIGEELKDANHQSDVEEEPCMCKGVEHQHLEMASGF